MNAGITAFLDEKTHDLSGLRGSKLSEQHRDRQQIKITPIRPMPD
jgi:hypothetical protein